MMKRLSWLSFFLIPVLALAGCLPIGRTSQPTPKVPLSSTITITVKPPLISTVTPALPDTETPTLTATVRLPTATPALTAKPTPIDTLAPEMVTATLQSLYKYPLNCGAVPCFWGIIPGQTRLDDARPIFGSLGFMPFEGIDQETGLYFYTITFESQSKNGRDSHVTFFIADNIIKNFKVTTANNGLKEFTPQDWIGYSPQTLIKQYGRPSRVVFGVGNSEALVVTMIMFFDSSDLIAYYSGINMIPGRPPHSPRLCPLTDPFDLIRLWMGSDPPHTPDKDAPVDMMVPLEKATTLTIDQFTLLMLGDPQKACFILNGDTFPNNP